MWSFERARRDREMHDTLSASSSQSDKVETMQSTRYNIATCFTNETSLRSESMPLQAELTNDEIAPVRWTFILVYALGYTGTWLALLTPVLVSIAIRVRQLAPITATEDLAMVLGVGAMFALVGNPVFGHLSDRTTSRFGMRRPWLVGGMFFGSLALLMIALAPTVTFVLIGWCLAQLAFNAVLAAMLAILPDQIPTRQRGTVSGVLAICLPVGQALGTLLVHQLATSTLLLFMLPAAIGFTVVLVLAWMLPDRRLASDSRPLLKTREWLSLFWVNPRAYPDFAWAWISRFLFVMGTAFITTYQPFYLMDNLGFALREIPRLVSQSVGAQAAMIVLFSLISGKLSDVLNRRKLFLFIGGALYAVGLWLIAGAANYSEFVWGMIITGAGHGLYFGTDLALATEVLPDRYWNSGKDLGILNMANALPQSIAPALGSVVLLLAMGSYTWLYALAGCIALLSSITILPLKQVR
jgi:MFS family permease